MANLKYSDAYNKAPDRLAEGNLIIGCADPVQIGDDQVQGVTLSQLRTFVRSDWGKESGGNWGKESGGNWNKEI